MKKEYKAVVRAYFSDYACWLFGVTVLLAAAFAIGMRGGVGGGVWVIPILLFFALCAVGTAVRFVLQSQKRYEKWAGRESSRAGCGAPGRCAPEFQKQGRRNRWEEKVQNH